MPAKVSSKTHVVVVHGLGGHWAFMKPLAWNISRAGYSTSTFGYRSWLWSVEYHARNLRNCLDKLQRDSRIDAINIVAHSMGSIVTRAALLDSDIKKVKRLVLLAPPNSGSPAARRLGAVFPFLKTVRQLSDRHDSFVRSLPAPNDVETGILTGSYDFVIPQENSHLSNETDHTTIFSGHNGLLFRPKATRCVIDFLHEGKFST